jgi:hypothetical protein
MSGFEIAGIVLAVIPIIHDALKDAPETGIGKQGSAFRQAARRRREFALKLFLIDTELRNSMLDIFKWVKLPLTDVQWDHLMSKRTMGPKLLQIWNDLLETLPQEMNTAFKNALEEIRDVLESIEEILVAIVVHTHISYDDGRQKLRSIAKDKKDCTLAMKGHIKDRFCEIIGGSRCTCERNDGKYKIAQVDSRNTPEDGRPCGDEICDAVSQTSLSLSRTGPALFR